MDLIANTNTEKEHKDKRREKRAMRNLVRVRACCLRSYSQLHLILEISLMEMEKSFSISVSQRS